MNCVQCNKETDNPKFCSRSCAATCNNSLFPKRIKQEKVKRVNQKYDENGKRINNNGSVCLCSRCKRKYVYFRGKHNNLAKCKPCYIIERRQKIKQELVDLKGGKCIRCGYNKSLYALAFHHRERDTKETIISKLFLRNRETLMKELEKCDLVCNNCHSEIHEEERIAIIKQNELSEIDVVSSNR